jgi:hypothetical protein
MRILTMASSCSFVSITERLYSFLSFSTVFPPFRAVASLVYHWYTLIIYHHWYTCQVIFGIFAPLFTIVLFTFLHHWCIIELKGGEPHAYTEAALHGHGV